MAARPMAAALALFVFLSGPVAQAQTYAVDATYQARLIGIRVGSARIIGTVGDGSYNVRMEGSYRLLGMRGNFAASAQGSVSRNANILPASYVANGSGRTNWAAEVDFEDGHAVRSRVEPVPSPEEEVQRIPLSEKHLRSVFDPLSGILAQILRSSIEENPCQGSIPVFSGAVRFDVVMNARDRNEDGGGWNCVAVYRPIAGHDPRRSQERLGNGVTITFPPAQESKGDSRLPVRIEVPLRVGRLVIERVS